MPTIKEELEEVKLKYAALREEWGLQQEHLGRLQTQISGLHNQLQQQSAFCASLGAILGHLLWKASRSSEIVEGLTAGVGLQAMKNFTVFNFCDAFTNIYSSVSIKRSSARFFFAYKYSLPNRIGDFFLIVIGTLTSFMDTYKQEIPSQNSDESQFVMSLVGIVTNIAAAAEGRLFLIIDAQGKNLIKHFVRMLQFIPVPSGNCLKRLIYMSLYNISINNVGIMYLQGQPLLITGIVKTLEDNNHPQELQLMALRLLQSLTWDVNCNSVLEHIMETVSEKLLEKFMRSCNEEFSTASTAIINNIEKNKLKFQNLKDCSTKYAEPL